MLSIQLHTALKTTAFSIVLFLKMADYTYFPHTMKEMSTLATPKLEQLILQYKCIFQNTSLSIIYPYSTCIKPVRDAQNQVQ